MATKPAMRRDMAETGSGKYREETSQDAQQAPAQVPFSWPDPQLIADLVADVYEAARGAAKARTDGRDYEGHLADQFNRANNRGLKIETIVAMLRDPLMGPPLHRALCKVARFTVGEAISEIDPRKLNRRLLEKIWRLPRSMREPTLREVADEIGCDVESISPPDGWTP